MNPYKAELRNAYWVVVDTRSDQPISYPTNSKRECSNEAAIMNRAYAEAVAEAEAEAEIARAEEIERCKKIDRWNDGALDGCRNRPQASTDPDYLAGYAEGQEQRKVRVVMPERPEGYYHALIGTFGDC